MSHWQGPGQSNEWFTPAYIFDALGCVFDLDVAAPRPPIKTHVPARRFIHENSLEENWEGFIWMNPPFGGRNGIKPWLDKFFDHNNGVALAPDRTSAPWFQETAPRARLALFLTPKVKFQKPSGEYGGSPSGGTVLFAAGWRGEEALRLASPKLGLLFQPVRNAA